MLSRRKFLKGGAASFGAAAATATTVPKVLLATSEHNLSRAIQEPSKNKVLHIIGYAHVDAAYLWPWRDGANQALNTFRSALDRMKETAGFRYSHSSTIHYQWVQRTDPRMFAEIR